MGDLFWLILDFESIEKKQARRVNSEKIENTDLLNLLSID